MLTLILALCMALGVSFVCSVVEAALLSLTPANVAQIAQEDAKKGQIWLDFKTNIDRPISVILLLNTAAHTIGAAVSGAKFSDIFGSDYLWIFSLVFTFLMLQYTEILPKTLGVRYRMALARAGAVPLEWSVRILSPMIALIRFINRPFESKGTEEEGASANPIDEITSLAAMARNSKQIGSRQEKIIFSATHLARITARHVMIPMEQVMFLSTKNTIQEAFLIAHTDLHTRYPVQDGDRPDAILGYVNFKELVYFMSTNPNNPSLSGIIRPLNFVTPETTATDLFRLFVDQYNHMVVVRDATGANLGIVTIEDVLEELVGEIEDEFDRLPQHIHSLAGGVWMAGGGASMDELSRRLGENLGGEKQTLGDWLAGRLQSGFKRGDSVTAGNFEMAVRRIKRGRIFDAAITDLRLGRPGAKQKIS